MLNGFKRLMPAALRLGLMFLCFAPAARAQTDPTVLIHTGTNFIWYTTQSLWNTNQANISVLFDYMDREYAQMVSDWRITPPQSQYYLWVDPNTGGGFAAGDISQIHTAVGHTAPGIGVAYDAYSNVGYGIKGFWAYAIGTHETANLLTGQALSAGWPRDWWADDKSPFPAMSAVRVEAELGQAAVSAAHDSTFAGDNLYKMMKNLQARYGWGIFQRMFAQVKTDGMQWTSLDLGYNPSAILTAYVTAYIVMGATNTLTVVQTNFSNVVPGYNSIMTAQVLSAWSNWKTNGGDGGAFLNGRYLSVGGFPDFRLSMPAPNTLTVVPGGSASTIFQITNANGFSGNVALSATGLPSGVSAACTQLVSNNFRLTLTASGTAPAGAATITLTGTSAGVPYSAWHAVTLPVIVSGNAAQTAVNLAPAATLYGVGNDHLVTGDNGGIDGAGFAYSGTLLGSGRTYSNTLFAFGKPADGQQGTYNAVTGITVPVPAGNFTSLRMLGSATGGNHLNQTFIVTYTDGTSASFTQSLSDWTAPANYAGESIVMTMIYADVNLGTFTANRYLYGYSFTLDSNKVAQSFTLPGGNPLPGNSGVVALALTLNGTAVVAPPLTATLAATPTNGAAPLTVQFTGQAAGGSPLLPFDTTDDHLGTITARGDNPPNETKANAFDDNASTKWLDFSSGTSRSSWIQYQYPGGQQHIVTQYTITSANDSPERDPTNWKLLGSTNGGVSFVMLDVRTNQTFPSRIFTKAYTFTNATAYNIYRFTNDTVLNSPSIANSVQLAELQFLEVPALNYTYLWSLGDGATATTKNPLHTYTTNGIYTVALVVSDGVSTATNTLTVMALPLTLSAALTDGGGTFQLGWPAWAAGYQLYSTTNLSPPVVWSPVTDPITTNGTTFNLVLPASPDHRFFRLGMP